MCQNLAGIAAFSTTLARQLAAGAAVAPEAASEITGLLNETIGHARDLARGLNPVGLEQIGLSVAREGLAANVQTCSRSPAPSSVMRLLSGLPPKSRRTCIASPRKP